MVDDLTHGPEGGDRHEVALHQATGRILPERQAFFQRSANIFRDRVQYRPLLFLAQGVQNVDGIILVQCRDRLRHPAWAKHFHQCVTHRLVHLRQCLGFQSVADHPEQGLAAVTVEQLEQVSLVGSMQPGERFADLLLIAGV